MRDSIVSHGRGARTTDCAAAHGACALCITKGAIWKEKWTRSQNVSAFLVGVTRAPNFYIRFN